MDLFHLELDSKLSLDKNNIKDKMIVKLKGSHLLSTYCVPGT